MRALALALAALALLFAPQARATECCKSVRPLPPLTVDFTCDETSGEVPFSVVCTAQESGGANFFLWDVDDDNLWDGFEQVFAWTFDTPGTYSPKVVGFRSADFRQTTKQRVDYLTASSVAGASLAVAPTYATRTVVEGAADASSVSVGVLNDGGGIGLSYTAALSGTPSNCGGTTGTGWVQFAGSGVLEQHEIAVVQTTFAGSAGCEPGYYVATGEVTSSEADDSPRIVTFALNVTGSGTELVADFSCSPLAGNAPLTVTCYDASQGGAQHWQYDFDATDPGPYNWSSPFTNPKTHTYSSPGTYDVHFLVWRDSDDASDELTKTGYVTVSAPSNPPFMVPAPTSITLRASPGQAPPAAPLMVQNSGGDTPPFFWSPDDQATNGSDCPWLDDLSAVYQAGQSQPISGSGVVGLAGGTYDCRIRIASGQASNSPVDVPVSLLREAYGGDFDAIQASIPQTVLVGRPATPFAWSYAKNSGAAWSVIDYSAAVVNLQDCNAGAQGGLSWVAPVKTSETARGDDAFWDVVLLTLAGATDCQPGSYTGTLRLTATSSPAPTDPVIDIPIELDVLSAAPGQAGTSATYQWTAATSSGPAIDGYDVWVREEDGGYPSAPTAHVAGLSYTLSGEAGKTYRVAVSATAGAERGPWSPESVPLTVGAP